MQELQNAVEHAQAACLQSSSSQLQHVFREFQIGAVEHVRHACKSINKTTTVFDPLLIGSFV